MTNLIKNKKYAYMFAIFAMFLWGSAFPVIKITNASLGLLPDDNFAKIFIAGIRFMGSGLILLFIVLFFRRSELKQIRPNIKFLSLIAFLQTTLQYYFFYIGVSNTGGMKSSILQASGTFLVVIWSHFLLKDDKLSGRKVFAVIIGLAGVIIANINKNFDLSFKLQAEGFMLINALISSFSTILIKKSGKDISAFILTMVQMILGSIILIAVGYIGMKSNLNFSLKSILLIAYASLLSATAFVIWYQILAQYKASQISFLRLFIPFSGTFLSAIFLKESLNMAIIIGLIFVIIGIIIINKDPYEKRRLKNNRT